jgi:predicted DNA-binding protein (UPF0251 family)
MPQITYYKPRGIPLAILQCVELTVDELEAIRLADFERLYQEEAAQRMNVSRQTFGRVLDAAHAKVADALVHGKALSIRGGPIEITMSGGEPRPTCHRGDSPPPAGRRCCRRRRMGMP